MAIIKKGSAERFYHSKEIRKMIHKIIIHKSSDGRVVKALDLKSNGVSPRRFKSCSLRASFVKVFFPCMLFWQGFQTQRMCYNFSNNSSIRSVSSVRLSLTQAIQKLFLLIHIPQSLLTYCKLP